MKTVDAKVVYDEDNLQALVRKFVEGCVVRDDNHFEVGGGCQALRLGT